MVWRQSGRFGGGRGRDGVYVTQCGGSGGSGGHADGVDAGGHIFGGGGVGW